MRRTTVRQAFLMTAAVVVIAGLVTALWLLSGTDAQAQATVVGIDVETTGNTKTNVDDVDTCITKAEGDAFLVDVYVDDLPDDKSLTSFSYTLFFDEDGDRLEMNDQSHSDSIGLLSVTGSPDDTSSEGVPDLTSPHTVLVSEFVSPEMGVAQGVLGRYTLEVKTPAVDGLAHLTLEAVSLSGPEGEVTVTEVRSAIIAIDDEPCPTPTATPSPSPSPSPTPSPTASPSPTPSPTPTAAPTRTLTLTPAGWHNFVWTGTSSNVAAALNCIVGKYSAAYEWVGTATPPQWLRYFPTAPAISSLTTVNQYDALLVLITADGVTCPMTVAPGPTVIPTATATATPTPTPTPTP